MGQRWSCPADGAGWDYSSSVGAQLSVVVPALNEEANLGATLGSVTQGLCPACLPEIVVVDGGSTDGTVRVARAAGKHVKVVCSARGRGVQLNAGWRAASRPWCLFLHADSRLPPGYLTALAPILLPRCSPPPVVAAAAAHAVAAQAEPALDGDGGDASLWAPQPLLCGTAERPLEGAPPQRASTSGAADAGGSSRPRTSPWRRRIGGKRCQPGCSCAGHIGRHPPSAPECSHCGRPPPASEPPAAAHPWWPPALPPWRSTSSKPAAWGCFRTIQTEWRDTWRGWLLTGGVALRTRWLGQPYGDQGIFVQRALLERVNGLPDWPLLEDCELVRRVKAATGRGPVIVPLAVETSGRRWERLGFWRTVLLNQAVLLAWMLGVPPATLAEVYYAQSRRGAKA